MAQPQQKPRFIQFGRYTINTELITFIVEMRPEGVNRIENMEIHFVGGESIQIPAEMWNKMTPLIAPFTTHKIA